MPRQNPRGDLPHTHEAADPGIGDHAPLPHRAIVHASALPVPGSKTLRNTSRR